MMWQTRFATIRQTRIVEMPVETLISSEVEASVRPRDRETPTYRRQAWRVQQRTTSRTRPAIATDARTSRSRTRRASRLRES